MRPALTVALVVLVITGAARADRPRTARPKPSPPVTLTITTQPAAAGTTLVVLDAVTSRDVPAIALTLGTRIAAFGATRAGEHRRVALELPSAVVADVTGAAQLGRGIRVWTRIAAPVATPIAARAEPRPFTVLTVHGRSVAEVHE